MKKILLCISIMLCLLFVLVGCTPKTDKQEQIFSGNEENETNDNESKSQQSIEEQSPEDHSNNGSTDNDQSDENQADNQQTEHAVVVLPKDHF